MMDLGQDPTAGFFSGLIVPGAVNIWCTNTCISDLVLIDTVVQQWLLAIDRDCIAVGLLFESPPIRTMLHICNTVEFLIDNDQFCISNYSTDIT